MKNQNDRSFSIFRFSTIILAELIVLLMITCYYSLQYHANYSIEKYTFFFKVLFIPSLFLAWWFNFDNHPKLIILFLIFSWFGDCLLIKMKERIFYVAGGIFFLFSHFCVIAFFHVKSIHCSFKALLFIIPMLFYPILFIYPIIISNFIEFGSSLFYVFVIMFAGFCSSVRFFQYGETSATFILCYIGYILYLLSDCILLSATFYHSSIPECLQMSAYTLAIVLITIGMSLQNLSKERISKQI